MKVVKYILFTLLGLIAIFLLIGLLSSSVQYGSEILVDKPIKEAWAVTLDESKYDQWLEGYKSIELLEGVQGEIGSKYKVIVQPSPDEEEFEMIETVVSLKEFEYVEMHFESDFMNFEQIIRHSESDGVTQISSESKVIGKNIFLRSMFGVMEILGGSFTAQEKKNFEALKKVIENNETVYYPELSN